MSSQNSARDPVAVVGTSTSGLLTATLLARAGREVVVYDRAAGLVPARRTLIVTSSMHDYLGGVDTDAVTNEVDRYELFANGKVGEVRLGRPDLIIERSVLISDLARAAVEAGAEIRWGWRFTGLAAAPRGGCVLTFHSTEHGKVETRSGIVVGADGAGSSLATAAGWRRQPTIPLLQAIVATPEDLPSRTSRVWFVPDDTPYFYWLIPDRDGRSALGVIGAESSNLRTRFDRFLEKRRIEALEYQGACIPRYARWRPAHRRLGDADIYLVGDAAGQVKVSTVGGIVTGFRGALGVTEAITRGSTKHLRLLKRELDAHLLVRRVLHNFGESEYCRLLDLLNDPTRESLQKHTRDDATAILWRVALRQPRFLRLSLKGLLSRAF